MAYSVECCEQGKYLTLGNFQTEAHWAMFAYISTGIIVPVGAYFGYLSMHEGRKRAKYQRALQEVSLAINIFAVLWW